jgi:hypothetical protein
MCKARMNVHDIHEMGVHVNDCGYGVQLYDAKGARKAIC